MQRRIGQKLFGGALAACIVLGAGAAAAEEVGKVGVDWVGNDIIVEAIKDPKVEGVTCHVSYFDRSVIDRLHKGNWFEATASAMGQPPKITGWIGKKQGVFGLLDVNPTELDITLWHEDEQVGRYVIDRTAWTLRSS